MQEFIASLTTSILGRVRIPAGNTEVYRVDFRYALPEGVVLNSVGVSSSSNTTTAHNAGLEERQKSVLFEVTAGALYEVCTVALTVTDTSGQTLNYTAIFQVQAPITEQLTPNPKILILGPTGNTGPSGPTGSGSSWPYATGPTGYSPVLAQDRYYPPTYQATGSTGLFFNFTGTTNSDNTMVIANTSDRGLNFQFGTSPVATGPNVRWVGKQLKTTAAQSAIAKIDMSPYLFNYEQWGIIVSDGTKFIIFGPACGTVSSNQYVQISLTEFTNSTTFSATQTSNVPGDYIVNPNCVWLRVDFNSSGATTNWFFSTNGKDWLNIYSVATSGFLTPKYIGVGINVQQSAGPYPPSYAYVNCLYWADADIVPPV